MLHDGAVVLEQYCDGTAAVGHGEQVVCFVEVASRPSNRSEKAPWWWTCRKREVRDWRALIVHGQRSICERLGVPGLALRRVRRLTATMPELSTVEIQATVLLAYFR